MRIEGPFVPPPGSSPQQTYQVQNGDTLHSIANQFQVSSQSLADANNLKLTDQLPIGRELIIPDLFQSPPAENQGGVFSDQVERYVSNNLFGPSEMGIAQPSEMGTPAPEMGIPAPEMGAPAPEMGIVEAPEMGVAAPEMGIPAPEMGTPAPEMGIVETPEMGVAAPEMGVALTGELMMNAAKQPIEIVSDEATRLSELVGEQPNVSLADGSVIPNPEKLKLDE